MELSEAIRLVRESAFFLDESSESIRTVLTAAEAKEREHRLARLVLDWWSSIKKDAHGFAGYHLNDEVATWDEFPEIEEMVVEAEAVSRAWEQVEKEKGDA